MAAVVSAGVLVGVLATSGVAASAPELDLGPGIGEQPGPPGAQPFIVGGSPASVDEHPYVVYLANSAGTPYCGGTLIEPDRVLTAAHCVDGVSTEDYRIVAGREDTNTDEGSVHEAQQVWVPEDYTSVREGSDIAVLTLDRPADQGTLEVAGPGETERYAPETLATILGWGSTEEGGTASNQLREAEVPIRADGDCSGVYAEYDPETMVCAGFPDGGIDACQGDSGGPLIVDDVLIGIISWGEGCARADRPGVYTDVREFSEQIDEQSARDGGVLTAPARDGGMIGATP